MYRSASVPPLGLLLPLRPAISRAALSDVWALCGTLCAASAVPRVGRAPRRPARALRAPQGYAALVVPRRCRISREYASRAARSRLQRYRHGATPWPFAASVIPRPSPVSALRFAAYGGSLRARRFPTPAA